MTLRMGGGKEAAVNRRPRTTEKGLRDVEGRRRYRLDGGCEDDELVILGCFPQEFIAARAFGDIHLEGRGAEANRDLEVVPPSSESAWLQSKVTVSGRRMGEMHVVTWRSVWTNVSSRSITRQRFPELPKLGGGRRDTPPPPLGDTRGDLGREKHSGYRGGKIRAEKER